MSIIPVLLWTLGYSWTSPYHRIQIKHLCIQHSRCHNFNLTRCPASSIQTTITLHEVGDVLLPPVWELFHGTLYHKSVLTLALPPAQHSLCIGFDHSSITSHPSCQLPLVAWVLRNPILWSSSPVISGDRGYKIPLLDHGIQS